MNTVDGTEMVGLIGLGGVMGMGGIGGGNGAVGTPASLAWLLFMETGEMGYYMLHNELKGGFKPLD